MAKFKPGIPDSFTLNVAPVQDLGDYLDEPAPLPSRPAKVAPRRPQMPPTVPAAVQVAVPVAAPRDSAPREQVFPAVPLPPQAPIQAAAPAPAEPAAVRPPGDRGRPPKPPRREITMTPDALRMSDELLDLVRSGSGQRDTTPSELFHALVLLAYEARAELDAFAIPRRGQWGSPTARAYPLEIKNALLKALLRRASDQGESRAGPYQEGRGVE